MKKEIYVCSKCNAENKCIMTTNDILHPSSCINYGNGLVSNWQKTTDYEITKKSIAPRGEEPNFKTDFKNISVPWKGKNKLSPALAKLSKKYPAPPEPPPKRKIEFLTPGPAAKKAMEKIHIFESKKDMEEFIERRVAPNLTTPNCAICQWKDQEKYKTEYSCGGQGMRKLTSVYGNKICKRLFKEKPGTEPDQE